ncbi:MAG: PD-(D/E)XK nuclease family protein [Christensenellales bacterium]
MKLILSNTTKGAMEGTIAELAENFEEAEHVFIVPDRFSMSMEKELLLKLKKQSCFNLEVVTFNRLAYKILGGSYEKCLTPEGSVMLLQRVIKRNVKSLKYFVRVAEKVSFARELYASLTEFRNSGVTADELRTAASDLNGGLKDKFSDLALLLEEYENALCGGIVDSTTRLTGLAERLKNQTLTQKFYICGFSSFKNPEMKVVESLAKNASSLTIGLVNGIGNKNGRIYPYALQKELESIDGVTVEKVWHNVRLGKENEIISDRLFSYSYTEKKISTDKISIVNTHNPFDEAKWLATEILKIVKSGKRFMDIAVCVPNLGGYADILCSAFKRFNIPYFADKQRVVGDTLISKYVLSLLRIKSDDYVFSSVNDFVKNPLFGTEAFEFENYCLKYSVEYVKKPFVYGDFENAELVRQKMAKKADSIPSVAKCGEFVDILIDEIEKISESEAYNAVKSSGKENCDVLELSKKKIEEVLKELSSVLGEEDMTVDEFIQTFSASVNQMKFSLIPLYIDCVFIGDVNESKVYETKYTFILGASEGAFPAFSEGGMVLTVQMEDLLAEKGVRLNQSAKAINRKRMMNVIDLLLSPTEKLYLSCPQTSVDRSITNQAGVLSELKSYFDLEEIDFDFLERDIYEKENLEEIAVRYRTAENCGYELMGKLGGKLNDFEKKVADIAYFKLDDGYKERISSMDESVENLNLISPVKPKTTSVSKLEKFYKCPCQYYFAYTLGLKRREEMEILTTETGTIIHNVLEKFFSDEAAVEDTDEFIENQFREILSEDRFKAMSDSVDGITMIARLKKECKKIVADLKTINARSKFKPEFVEADFSDNGIFSPITLRTKYGDVKLIGKIDRVDSWNGYVLIIDYKSFRSADISFKDVYFGNKIQLYIYLNAICNQKGYSPAGAFYLPLFNAYTTEENRYKLKGQVLFDKDIIQAIDSAYQEKYSIVDVSENAKGEIKKKTDLYSLNDFAAVMQYAKDIAVKGTELIAEGYVKASPCVDACSKCDYFEICKDRNVKERSLSNVKLETITGGDETAADGVALVEYEK